MKIVDRYIIRFLIGPFIFGTLLVVFLFLMQFLMLKLDDLVGKGLDNLLILQLIALNLPSMIVIAVPMGTLFGSLMAFGNMSSHHEVTVIKASGSSLLRMMRPIIVLGVLLTSGLFWFNNYVLPETNHQARTLLNDIKRKKPTFLLESGRFSTDLNGFTILARKVDSISGGLKKVTIYDKSDVRNYNIISADSGSINFNSDYSKLIIKLYTGDIHQMKYQDTRDYKIIGFDEYTIYQNVSGFSLERTEEDVIKRGNREMGIKQMKEVKIELLNQSAERKNALVQHIENHINYLFNKNLDSNSLNRNQEIDNSEFRNDLITRRMNQQRIISKDSIKVNKYAEFNKYDRMLAHFIAMVETEKRLKEDYKLKADGFEVEIQKKYSIPVACLLFIFVGCPLGIITRGGNFGISAAISLAFYIVYWVFLLGGEKLADRGYIMPEISMWIGNLIIGFVGLFLTYRVSYESSSIKSIFKKLFKKK